MTVDPFGEGLDDDAQNLPRPADLCEDLTSNVEEFSVIRHERADGTGGIQVKLFRPNVNLRDIVADAHRDREIRRAADHLIGLLLGETTGFTLVETAEAPADAG